MKTRVMTAILSIFLVTVVFLVFSKTDYTFAGISGDYGFRTSYVTKLANTSTPVDFTYKNLPAFYPPLYFYVLGGISSLIKIEPYKMLRFGLFGAAFVIPFLTYGLWRHVVDEWTALIVTFGILLQQIWTSPHEWISLAMFVPWWLHYVLEAPKSTSRYAIAQRVAIGGLLGSIIFQMYYYWFFVGLVSVFVEPFLLSHAGSGGKVKIPARIVNKVSVFASTALFSAGYWLPCLHSMYRSGGWESLQSRYFAQSHATLPLPFFEFSVQGVILLAGLIYLLMTMHKDSISFGLFTLLSACYVWFLVGYVGVLLGRPLLSIRADVLEEYVLYIAALLALKRLLSEKLIDTSVGLPIRRATAILTGSLFLLAGQTMLKDLSHHEYLKGTFDTKYPNRLLGAFREITQGRYREKVILTNHSEIPIYLPVYSFLAWNAYYSHPAGLFRDRVTFLEEISRLDDERLFALALINNPYDKIDYVMLPSQGDSLVLRFYDDNFPNTGKWKSISFPRFLFDSQYFIKKTAGGHTLYEPRL